jgi:hypothetical protein
LASEKDYGVGAPEDLAVFGKDAHFFESLFSSQVESLLDPLALERFEIESAFGKQAIEPEGEIPTEAAIFVEKDPAEKGN